MLCRQQHHIINALFRKCSTTIVQDFQKMPQPKGLPFIGTTLSLLAAGSTPKLHRYVDKRHKELGNIFKENIGPVSAVFMSDPNHMRAVFAQEGKYPVHILPESWMVYNDLYGCSRGLFFMDGEQWLHFRRIMNKLLLKGDLTYIEKACNEVNSNLLDRIHQYKNQEYPNLDGELYKWSLDILVAILLGADTYKLTSKDLEPLVQRLASTVHLVFHTSAKLSLISAKFASKYKIPRWKKFVKSIDDALLAANELVEHLKVYKESDGLLAKMQAEGMDEAIIQRIVADLVLAAGDTTAYSMQWMLLLIAKNKLIQTQLRQELIKEAHPALLKNVMRESLRLYPVAPFLTRILPEAASIAGFNIPAGTLIVLSVFSSGRDVRFYADPETFNPDRWLRIQGNNSAASAASLPFAIGARSCIGKKIAEMQLQLTLAMIVRNFQVELLNDAKDDIDVVLKMVAVPDKPIRLNFGDF